MSDQLPVSVLPKSRLLLPGSWSAHLGLKINSRSAFLQPDPCNFLQVEPPILAATERATIIPEATSGKCSGVFTEDSLYEVDTRKLLFLHEMIVTSLGVIPRLRCG